MLARIKQQLRHGSSWILLAMSVLIAQVGAGFYTARDMQMPGPLWAVNYAVQLTALGFWLERDNRQRRVLRIWDIGFFLYVAWVVVIPYYLVKTRGVGQSVLIMVAWVGAYVVAYLVALFIFI